jgi:hypothetical protein
VYIVRCFHQNSCEWNNAYQPTEEEIKELNLLDLETEDLNTRKIGLPILDEDVPPQSPIDHYYKYKNVSGDTIMLIHRRTSSTGKKIFPMFKSVDGLEYGTPDGKFLYNSDLILKYKDVPILVVEGEKAADSAQQAFLKARKKVIVTTWPLGTPNVIKGDWSLLKNRNVTLWPDNDETGIKAMSKVMEILKHVNSIS